MSTDSHTSYVKPNGSCAIQQFDAWRHQHTHMNVLEASLSSWTISWTIFTLFLCFIYSQTLIYLPFQLHSIHYHPFKDFEAPFLIVMMMGYNSVANYLGGVAFFKDLLRLRRTQFLPLVLGCTGVPPSPHWFHQLSQQQIQTGVIVLFSAFTFFFFYTKLSTFFL